MIELEEEKAKVQELIEIKEPEVIKAREEKRPEVLDARIYKLKSAFVDSAIYVALSYIEDENGQKRPFEIFINSKDLTKAAEYAVLTRLISAIFRRSEDPIFILEELKSIYDPNGGYLKDGKYVPSLYAEIAEVLEMFFKDIGIIKKKEVKKLPSMTLNIPKEKKEESSESVSSANSSLKICPKCNTKSLKLENGCNVCINPE
ncbi:MAG: hypothetical protein D6769_03415, partial [Methanobacteriota archaeon]